MDGEAIHRLMEVILQMKINLAHVTETLQQQTWEIRHELEAIFEKEKGDLENCLRSIDDKIKECAVGVEEYKRLHERLLTMRHKLVQLGAEPTSLPAPLPSAELEGIVTWRLQTLREQGKV